MQTRATTRRTRRALHEVRTTKTTPGAKIDKDEIEIRNKELELERARVVANALSLPEEKLDLFRRSCPGMIASSGYKAEAAATKKRLACVTKELDSTKTRLTDAKDKLDEATTKIEEMEKLVNCCVCRSSEKTAIFDCGHGYCEDCIQRLANCPICGNNNMEIFPLFL